MRGEKFGIGATIVSAKKGCGKILVAAYQAMAYAVIFSLGEEELFSARSEDVILQRRADSVAGLIIFIVVAKMVLLHSQPNAPFDGKMVRGVVDHVLAKIATHKPCEKS
jgi:hypothetical protein